MVSRQAWGPLVLNALPRLVLAQKGEAEQQMGAQMDS